MEGMYITIWTHHMQVDEVFDFLNDRIETPPAFWYSQEECPYSVTGGYVAINLNYDSFSRLRSVRDWEDPFQQNHYASFQDELQDTAFEEWSLGTLKDQISDWDFKQEEE